MDSWKRPENNSTVIFLLTELERFCKEEQEKIPKSRAIKFSNKTQKNLRHLTKVKTTIVIYMLLNMLFLLKELKGKNVLME